MSWGYKNKVQQDFDQQKYFDDVQDIKPVEDNGEQQDDPLDAYMKDMEMQAYKDKKGGWKPVDKIQKIFEQDPVDDYFVDLKKKVLKQHKSKRKQVQKYQNLKAQEEDLSEFQITDGQQCQFIVDGEVDLQAIRNHKKRKIEALEPVDYTQVKQQKIQKNFYNQHQQITLFPQEKVKLLRQEWNMKVKGKNVPKPIVSFAHLNFSQTLLDLIIKQNYQKPTPIQSQALPVCLSGRDIVGVAKTGSGKTLAYVWPMILHILDQRQLQKNEGPIGLVLAPTRELCQQIYVQTKKYSKKFNLSIGCLLGGENKHQQWKLLKAGVDILIASPGRLIQMIKKKATNLLRTTYLVLDEADKMFSLGFQPQIRSIVGQIRQDRQTCLFTATLKKTIQSLVVDILTDPITINIGQEHQANEDIKQQVNIFKTNDEKANWLVKQMVYFLSRGKVLVFVSQIATCNQLWEMFLNQNINALVLHGDKQQYQRTSIINSFKLNNPLLIATDVASRGLDVRQIKTVVNYDPPKDCDTYIHRIGRTGRAGDKDGIAYTLLLDTQVKFAISLIKILETTGSPVPNILEEVAIKDQKFKVRRMSEKMGVNFAKGKDATKLLNQALKRQRNSNLKAGLGYTEPDLIKKSKRQLQISDIIDKNKSAMQVDSEEKPLRINELKLLLTQQNQVRNKPHTIKPGAKTLFSNRFVQSETIDSSKELKQIVVTYAKGHDFDKQQNGHKVITNPKSKWDK